MKGKRGDIIHMTMMFNVVLKSNEDVKDFVYTASGLPGRIGVKVISEGKTANGRNLLGMLSISTGSKPLNVIVNYKTKTEGDDVRNKFYPWITGLKER